MPGELITLPWQIDWNGFLLGVGTVYSIQELDGWLDMPGLDMGEADKTTQGGSWPGTPRAQSRIVTLRLEIRATADRMGDAMRALRAATPRSATADEAPLAISLHDETLVAFGKISNRIIPVNQAYSQGLSPTATLQWLCADSRAYEPTEQSVIIGAPTGGSGGLIYPISYPLVYGVAATPSNATCTNNGNEATDSIIEFAGPILTPRLISSTLGSALEFNLDLPAGQTLTVDTDRGTVQLNGTTDRLYTRSNFSVPVEYFKLLPGDNDLTLTGATIGTGAQVQVRWKSASL